jgi:hypothetical protein
VEVALRCVLEVRMQVPVDFAIRLPWLLLGSIVVIAFSVDVVVVVAVGAILLGSFARALFTVFIVRSGLAHCSFNGVRREESRKITMKGVPVAAFG